MTRPTPLAAALLALGLHLGAPALAAGASTVGPRAAAPAAPGAEATPAEGPRLIVTLKAADGSTARRAGAARAPGSAAALGARHGLRDAGELGPRTHLLRGPAGSRADALIAALAADPAVAHVQADRRVRRHATPNDPRFASGGSLGPAAGQWYLRTPDATLLSAVDAPRAWDETRGRSSLVVAVLDTGIRPEHPDLAGKLVAGRDFITDPAIAQDGDGRDADPSDPGDFVPARSGTGCAEAPSSWHGTQVAGLVGAATGNGLGMAGAGWNLKVQPLRVLGRCEGFQSDIVAAMRWAAGIAVPGLPANPTPAQVINLSLGGSGRCDRVYQDAIDEVRARGVVVVASAGNSDGRAVTPPANCPGVIAVGGLRHNGVKVGFSDVGPEIALSAPAGNCVNTGAGQPCLYPLSSTTDTGRQGPVAASYTGDGADATLGTSFAAPLVSAAAGLVLSVQPGLSPDEVARVLRDSARPFPRHGGSLCRAPGLFSQLDCECTTSTCGAGMLDLGAAVRRAQATVPAAGGGGTGTGGGTVDGGGSSSGGGGNSGGGSSGGGGGGGPLSPVWLLGLALAVAALARADRADRRG